MQSAGLREEAQEIRESGSQAVAGLHTEGSQNSCAGFDPTAALAAQPPLAHSRQAG
jgi:hypothetical protein